MKTKKFISLILSVILIMGVAMPLAVTAQAQDTCTHNFVYRETVARTCSGRGYEVFVCPNCGAYEQRNMLEPTGHVDENDDGRCDNCDEQLPMYFIKHFIFLLLEFIKTILKIK